MKAAHHPELFASRAAGDVTRTVYSRGEVVMVETIKAGTADTAKIDIESKRGPKPKHKPDPHKFAESENSYSFYE